MGSLAKVQSWKNDHFDNSFHVSVNFQTHAYAVWSFQVFGILHTTRRTRAKIDQVDATLFVEQRLNNVVKVQQH